MSLSGQKGNDVRDYAGKGQQRIIRLVELLAGQEQHGLSLTEIATSMGVAVPTAYRDLQTLKAVGWGRRMESGRWCMDLGAAKPLAKVRKGIAKARAELGRIESEYLGGDDG